MNKRDVAIIADNDLDYENATFYEVWFDDLEIIGIGGFDAAAQRAKELKSTDLNSRYPAALTHDFG